jgi:hypothetical protein
MPTLKKCCGKTLKEYQSMTTSANLTESPTLELGYSQADFLASHSVSPGSAKARAMTVRSGLKCAELLRTPGPLGCLVKTCLESSAWNSTACFLTWKTSATPRGRLLFQLAPSTPNTDEIECGLWPTPRAANPGSRPNGKGGKVLEEEVQISAGLRTRGSKLLPTPRAADGTKGIRTAEGTAKERLRRKNGQDLPTTIGGRLNPAFVEWLMGYPIGWTDLKDSETQSCRKSRRN